MHKAALTPLILFAAIDIGRRELILNLQGIWHPYPTRTSIQVGSNHLESEAGACINHSCKPNAEILCVIYSMDPRDKPHFVPESAFAQSATRRPVLVSNQKKINEELQLRRTQWMTTLIKMDWK